MNTAGTETLGAVALLLRVPEDIVVALLAVLAGDGLVLALGVAGEGDGDNLVARGVLAVPRPVEGDVHVLILLVELAVEGGRVGLEVEAGRGGSLLAGGVGEGGVGLEEELGSRVGVAVGEHVAAPDGEAGWVAVPVLVGDGWVADWSKRKSAS